jgi:subtilisin family serine protease
MAEFALIFLLAIPMVTVGEAKETKSSFQDSETYTASWAVEIRAGGKITADDIAVKHCFRNMGKMEIGSGREIYHFKLCDSEKRSMKTDSPDMTKKEHLLREPEVRFAEQQVIRPRAKKSYIAPTDPLFGTQWNVLNSAQFGEQFRGNDLNVEPAWIQGYSGCNVTVAVVDDGLDFTHADLFDNFVSKKHHFL